MESEQQYIGTDPVDLWKRAFTDSDRKRISEYSKRVERQETCLTTVICFIFVIFVYLVYVSVRYCLSYLY